MSINNVSQYLQCVSGAIVDMMREGAHRISFVYCDLLVRADTTDLRETAKHQMICSSIWWRNHEIGHVGMYYVLIRRDVKKDEKVVDA